MNGSHDERYELVVVGATPAGCAAALAASRAGARVLLLEPTRVVGGMNSNGVHAFDTASLQAICGISEEFAARVRAHYAAQGLQDVLFESATDLYWESKVASSIWRAMLDEQPSLTIQLGAVPVDVITRGSTVEAVVYESAADAMGSPHAASSHPRMTARGKLIIDATYEGDIAAWAGVPFRLGREARSPEEPHAGVIYTTYLDRSPVNGYLPQTILPGSTGEGDERIMAFNCRLTCRIYASESEQARHRLTVPPRGYDPSNYAWDRGRMLPGGLPKFGTGLIPSVNGKFLLNCSTKGNDLVGPNRQYILARPRERQIHRRRFVEHALGFLYYIQNEGKSPDVGLTDDEFVDNGGLPYQIYVREGRRIEGRVLLTEQHVNPHLSGDGLRPPARSDAIAIGDWPIEGKKCRDDVPLGRDRPEGLMHLRGIKAPYQIPYGCLLPRDCRNLIVTCAISSTHIGYCAIRTESVFTHLGLAAGTAAALAIEMDVDPADVPLGTLQERLLRQRGKLTYFRDVESTHPAFEAIQWAAVLGVVPRDRKWRFFPDRSVTRAELYEMVVKCLELDISVSGAHFEGVDPTDPGFRFIESIYDLGSRCGVPVFDGMFMPAPDEAADHNRAELRSRWLAVDLDGTPSRSEAVALLTRVMTALGARTDGGANRSPDLHDSVLTRAGACALIKEFSAHA